MISPPVPEDRPAPAGAPPPGWAVVDATGRGEVGPATRVGGLPLVARHARQLARTGWAGARVHVVDDAGRAEVEGALRQAPPPPAFAVDVVVGPAPARLVLDARAIYAADAVRAAREGGAPPKPLVEVRARADVGRAERVLLEALRKSVDLDGVVSYYFMRPVSRLLSRLLVDTPVTPNQVTLVAMACGLLAAVLAGLGGAANALAAGVLFWVGATVDCVDGELARLRLQGSKLGEWLDTLADDLSTFGLLAGLGVGLWRDGAGDAWLAVAVVGPALGLATTAKLYADLHRLRLPIDTAQYPWFFGKASEGALPRTGLFGKAFYAVSFLFRRDAFVTIVALLLVVGLRRSATVVLAGGAMVIVVLLALHLVVTAARRRSPSRPAP